MKRKLIGALLFGAMVFAPTTTFVSCSDYDDEIAELREKISTNATDLTSLVDEKINNVKAEIEMLSAAQDGLAEAYKNADKALEEAYKNADSQLAEDYKAADLEVSKANLLAAEALVKSAKEELEGALKAAEARLDEQGKSIEALVKADAELQIGINDAAAAADKAYKLAEEAKALAAESKAMAEENKKALGELAENLNTVKGTLQDQINVLNDQINEVSKSLADQKASLEAQIAALQAQLEGEISGVSDAQKADVAKINSDIEALRKEVADLEIELRAEIDAQISAILEGSIPDIADKLEGSLKEMAENYGYLKEQIDGILENQAKFNQFVTDFPEEVYQEIENREEVIRGLISAAKSSADGANSRIDDLLNGDIKDLNDALTEANDRLDGHDIEISDLQGALGRLQGQFNAHIGKFNEAVERIDGEISDLSDRIDDIEGLVNVLYTNLNNLITSIIYQGNDINIRYARITKHGNSAVESADGKTIVFPYVGAKGPSLTMPIGKFCVEPEGGNVYATINPAEVDFGKDALPEGSIKMVDSQNNENSMFKLGAVSSSKKLLTRAVNTPNGFYEMPVLTNGTDFWDNVPLDKTLYALSTTYQQKNAKGENETRTVTSKYDLQVQPVLANAVSSIEIKGVENENSHLDVKGPWWDETLQCNIRFSGLTGTITIGDDNGSNRIHEGDIYQSYVEVVEGKEYLNDWTDQIISGETLTRDFSVKESGVNKPIKIVWYVLNYNGSVIKGESVLKFTKPIFEAETLTASHVPASSEIQEADITKEWNALNFMSGANKTTWCDNATKYTFTSTPLKALNFYNATGQLIKQPLTPAGNKQIAKVTVSYDPSEVVVGENVATVMFSGDGYIDVVTLNIKLNIIQPAHLDLWIDNSKRRIESAFDALLSEEEGRNADLTVAWVTYDATTGKAVYDLSGSFADLGNTFVRDALKPVYDLTKSNGSRYVFNDVTAYAGASEKTHYGLAIDNRNYTVSVNKAAIKAYAPTVASDRATSGMEAFKMTEGIDYYNLSNLNSGIDEFSIRFVSAVNYGVAKLQTKSPIATFETPGSCSINLNNVVSILDYSKSKTTDKIAWSDARIVKVWAELDKLDTSNNWDLVKNWTADKGIDKNNPVITFDITSTAVKTNAVVKFTLYVQDQFDIVTKHDMTFMLNPAQISEQARRK